MRVARAALLLVPAIAIASASCFEFETPQPGSDVIAVQVTPENVVIDVGAEAPLTALAILESGEARDVTESPATSWESSDESVVEIAPDGVASGNAAGEALVTATVDGIRSPAQRVRVLGIPTTPPPTPTPTAAPTADHVVISEVLYDAASSLGALCTPSCPESDFEYIELFNPTGSVVDVTGWALVNNGGTGTATPFPSLSIPAGGYLLIADDGSDANFDTVYGVTPDARVALGALSNTGEWLQLKDDTMAVVDELAYADGETGGGKPLDWCPPGDFPEAGGSPSDALDARSVARNPDGSDGDSCDDWQNDAMPSPRAANP